MQARHAILTTTLHQPIYHLARSPSNPWHAVKPPPLHTVGQEAQGRPQACQRAVLSALMMSPVLVRQAYCLLNVHFAHATQLLDSTRTAFLHLMVYRKVFSASQYVDVLLSVCGVECEIEL